MSTTSKALTSLDVEASSSNAAGATKTSSALSVNTLIGCSVVGKITNGATGPTVPGTFTLQYRYKSAGTLYSIGPFTSGSGNNAVSEFQVSIPDGAFEIVSIFDDNTGQAITVECHGAGLELSTV